jgi:hypothetical protein
MRFSSVEKQFYCRKVTSYWRQMFITIYSWSQWFAKKKFPVYFFPNFILDIKDWEGNAYGYT